MKNSFNEMYLENFAFTEGISSNKKFNKFASRIYFSLYDAICEHCEDIPNVFLGDLGKSMMGKTFTCFPEFVANCIFISHYGARRTTKDVMKSDVAPILKDNFFKKGSLNNFSVKYMAIPKILRDKDFRLFHKQQLYLFGNTSSRDEQLESIFDGCVENAIRYHLADLSIINGVEITDIVDAYKLFDLSGYRWISLVRDIIQTFNHAFLDLCIVMYESEGCSEDITTRVEKMVETIKGKDKEIFALNSSIEKLKVENATLKESLERERISHGANVRAAIKANTKDVDGELLEENLQLQRKLAKLQETLMDLQGKYEATKTSEATIVQKSEIFNNEICYCDKSKRYGFVVGENTSLINKLLEVFPNSIILNKDTKSFSVESVIFLTRFQGHADYYTIKGICDAQNIPYIHCHHKNLAIISNTISTSHIA